MSATLRRKASVSATSFLFTLETEPGFPRPAPGQFVNVEADAGLTLRRPLSVAGVPAPGQFDLLVEVRGTGTRALASKTGGDVIPVIGPLGNEFTMPEEGDPAMLVAGGIGVAGLRFLAQRLAEDRHPFHALVGARTKDALLDRLLPAGSESGVLVETATDDGSYGFNGTVVELLEKTLAAGASPSRVYCCGPPAMLRSAARVVLDRGTACEVLLEEMMACGVGACRGCVVNTRDGYRTVCSDGPVFDANELVLEELVRA